MALNNRRVLYRAVLAAVLISAVGLSACGRKGALEPPPSAAPSTVDPADTSDGTNALDNLV
ncbi:MAG: lipoprotein [Hyphomicrobiales bacterium]|nr:lipoprotein [Hyphomicrobiales bacterium]